MFKYLETFSRLVERFLLPLVLVVGFLLYQKFGFLFDRKAQGEKEAEENRAQHQDALVPGYADPRRAASSAARRKAILENGEKARLYKQALYAEKIRATTEFGIDFTRSARLVRIGKDMKLHRVSLSGTAVQYKKLTGGDLYKDARLVLGLGYTAWLQDAGSVK